MKKAVLIIMLGVMLFGASGCIGSFGKTSDLLSWNKDFNDSKWVNEAIFVGLVPVYFFAAMADMIVFNTMEFWSGDGGGDDNGSNPCDNPCDE